jgi:hypothetical protein
MSINYELYGQERRENILEEVTKQFPWLDEDTQKQISYLVHDACNAGITIGMNRMQDALLPRKAA